MTILAEVIVGADPAAWTACGFTVDADGTCAIDAVRFRLDPTVDGIAGIGLAGRDDVPAIVDGLAMAGAEPPEAAPAHPNGVTALDHLVVMTDDLERTIDAVVDGLGIPLKRIREAGPVRQAFFRLGAPILEVVAAPGTGARYWGLAFTVADLDAAADLVGPDRLTPPKDAVQPGRRIASFRIEAGLGVPVALLTSPRSPGRP